MEISLLQAFALGIIAFIAGLDMFNGLTHMHRPVVLGPLVGLVLGDLHTGILTGGICKTPADFLTLVKGGVPVNRINVGNMHYANGKQQIAKTVSVDAGDIAAFNDLKTAGVECFVQGVPTEPAVDLFKLL